MSLCDFVPRNGIEAVELHAAQQLARSNRTSCYHRAGGSHLHRTALRRAQQVGRRRAEANGGTTAELTLNEGVGDGASAALEDHTAASEALRIG